MGRGAGGEASRERAPGSAYRVLAIGVAASLAFTLLIWLLGGWLAAVPHAADAGASWYYWKLIEPTTASRMTAWGFYLLHQVSFWALIAYAQRTVGRSRPRYSTSLRSVNYLALGVNGLFIVLHLVQTHLWYDELVHLGAREPLVDARAGGGGARPRARWWRSCKGRACRPC